MRNAVVNLSMRHSLPGCPSCSSAGDEIRIFCSSVHRYIAVGLRSFV